MGKKVLFATDVDGTLLSSCIPEGEQMVIVDDRHNYKGRMTQSNYDILREISRYADIVPVTARSTNSSKQLFSAGLVEYKLVENGAVLLYNNMPVYSWKQQSEQLFGEATEKELFSNISSILSKKSFSKAWQGFYNRFTVHSI